MGDIWVNFVIAFIITKTLPQMMRWSVPIVQIRGNENAQGSAMMTDPCKKGD